MTAHRLIYSLFPVFLLAHVCWVLGDDAETSSDVVIRPGRPSIRKQLEERVAELRNQLTTAASAFERVLAADGHSDEAVELVKQLDWPRVKTEMAKPSPDVLLLRSYSKRLYKPLGLPEVQTTIRLRELLDEYSEILRVLSLPDIESEIRRRQTAVQEILASPKRVDSVRLGEHVDWLALVGRPHSLTSVQQQHNLPNIAVDIPKSVVKERIKQFNQEVTQSQYVSNVVAGTPISGVAHTTGTATAQLLPNESTAGFRVHLQGTINAPNNVAVQDPVVVYTSGQTSFSASKQIVWEGRKLDLGPTSVSCQTQSAITGIAVTRQPIIPLGRRPGPINRIIERAAWRRAAQQQPQGEAAASRLAESRVAETFNSQVGELVAKLNGQIEDYVIRPLLQSGMMPTIDAIIKPEAICVSLLRRGAGGLAGTKRPDWKINKDDFALHLHESALTNFMRASAGGAVWTDQDFADVQRVIIGTNSFEFRIGLHPRWEVTLDWARPIATRFDKDQITVEFNVESLRIENEDYKFPFSVQATYKMDTRPPVFGILRVGDLSLKWTGDAPADAAKEKMLATFIREKFSGLLLDELYLDGLKAPSGGGFWGALGSYRVNHAASEQGWMLVTFSD
jgi:hypothetical protein